MFFWGSYNFQVPQQTEVPECPPLRFPVYVPPSLPVLQLTDQVNNTPSSSSLTLLRQQQEQEELQHVTMSKLTIKTTQEDVQKILPRVQMERMRTVHAAAGTKHLLVLLSLPITCTHQNTNIIANEKCNNGESRDTDEVQCEENGSKVIYRNFLFGMGSNHSGQLGNQVNHFYTHTLTYLHVEGDEYCSKYDHAPYSNASGNEIVSMACGNKHSLLCNKNGSVFVSGDNTFGQLGLSPQELKRAIMQDTQEAQMSANNVHLSTHSHSLASTINNTKTNKSLSGVNSSKNQINTTNSSNNKRDRLMLNSLSDNCVRHFTQLMSLAHIVKVVAGHNVSFAIDHRGVLYSWGEAQYGQLAHNDDGSRVDGNTMKEVATNVTTPRRIRWFEQHHIAIVDCSVGKAHMVCMSRDGEVYTCGEGYFGKLGHNDIITRLEPSRVHFPPRKHAERLIAIAAGDDHTLVLKENSLLGSIVYFFGKLNNGDGQLTPLIVPIPSLSSSNNVISHIYAGRGNWCGCLCKTDGKFYVWGKHSYNKVYNGTVASASRLSPTPIEVLSPFHITHVVCGGTFCAVFANELQEHYALRQQNGFLQEEQEVNNTNNSSESTPVSMAKIFSSSIHKQQQLKQNEEMKISNRCNAQDNINENTSAENWSVIVPHDARVNKAGVHMDDNDEEDDTDYNEQKDDNNNNKNVSGSYETAVCAFLQIYLGSSLGKALSATIPPAPPRTIPRHRTLQVKRGAHELTIGSKVRLWMTDVYALGTVVQLNPPLPHTMSIHSQPVSLYQSQSQSQSHSQPPSRQLSLVRDAALSSQHQHHQLRERSFSQQSTHSYNNTNNSSTVLGVNNTNINHEGSTNINNMHNEEYDENSSNNNNNAAADVTSDNEEKQKVRVKVEWQRDDWDDEVLSLYSSDETLDERNDNRWQPLWFVKDDQDNYVV